MYDREMKKTAPENGASSEPPSSEGILRAFRRCADLERRELRVGAGALRAQLFWIDGLVSAADAAESLLRPLTEPGRCAADSEEDCVALILSGGVWCPSAEERSSLGELCEDLLRGRCALVFDGARRALSFELKSPARPISEPTLEKSLKGSRDTFVETLRVNTALVRRHAATPRLKIAECGVGKLCRTRVALLYVEDSADLELLRELAARLDALDADALVSIGALEQRLSDSPLSPFPQLLHTEKPDRLASWLLDGRVGVIADGIPLALALPADMSDLMKVGGDSSMNSVVASVLAALRYLALALGMYLPALYVAIASFHREMIPVRLLLSIIEAKKDVPFSTPAEVLGMLIAFALLQEAGLRLPNPVGDTVSIIGALIVGQSAVEARVVSPIAIIVVAVSGIACYTLPSQDLGAAVRLCRAGLLLAGMLAGLYGVGVASCLLLAHLASLESFGRSYVAPLGGGSPGGLLRLFVRLPFGSARPRGGGGS